ncbi:MAG: hypothetical protein J3K34DRAFT_496433 [Monoraphidium minutum]|nr:MAG: hypothetical protein J3K34DRAFT_496433 [Monoraphidium minutum]
MREASAPPARRPSAAGMQPRAPPERPRSGSGSGSGGPTPVPAALPFTVDGPWGDAASAAAGGKLQFLTHAHKDHTAGIEAGAAHLVCSAPTLRLLRIKHPGLGRRLDAGAAAATLLGPWQTLHLAAPERDGGYPYSVTALPLADHCAGALMLLFQCEVWGSLLHTGDCRLTPEGTAELAAYLCEALGGGGSPDTLWLDGTMAGHPYLDFPPLGAVIDEAVALIRARPGARVLLAAENLGTEELIAGVSEGLHRQRAAELDALLGPGTVADDPSLALHLIGGRDMRWLGRAVGGGGGRGRGGSGSGSGAGGGGGGGGGDSSGGGGDALVLRVSTMASALRQAEALADAPAGPAAAAAAARERVVAWADGGVTYLLWARHSSCRELRAALEVLRPRAAVAFAGSLRGLEGSLGGALTDPAQIEARFAAQVAAAAAAARAARAAARAVGEVTAEALAPRALQPSRRQPTAQAAAAAGAPKRSSPATRGSPAKRRGGGGGGGGGVRTAAKVVWAQRAAFSAARDVAEPQPLPLLLPSPPPLPPRRLASVSPRQPSPPCAPPPRPFAGDPLMARLFAAVTSGLDEEDIYF